MSDVEYALYDHYKAIRGRLDPRTLPRPVDLLKAIPKPPKPIPEPIIPVIIPEQPPKPKYPDAFILDANDVVPTYSELKKPSKFWVSDRGGRQLQKIKGRETCVVILRQLAKRSGFTAAQIISVQRQQALVDVRQELCYKLWRAGLSYPAIGELMLRDHSTICHSVREYKRKHPELS